ncbi:hypothetical protein [Kamptonema formosum]|uniref:hypothetical protein n=1 Tax=Kamptonema formosum TaxID=331992 RepID=UPI000345E027|nr:hypothetical protein [Oscillatoria sp. PCC 10802]
MAANYQQPEYVEKRLRYFDGQFLKDQDFIDEQKYHIDRQRRLSRILQVSGISEGVGVTSTAADTVSVAAGTAVDPKGRLIVLAEPGNVSVAGNRNLTVNLFISYQEVESDKAQEGSEGNRRWHEKPLIAVVAEGDPDPPESVKLAKLSVDKDGLVKVDSTVRQYSGVYLPAGGGNGPTLRSGGDSASNLAVLTGDLNVTGSLKVSGSLTSNSLSLGSGSITAGSATISGNLTTTGNAGIGTASPTEKLEIAGNIKASGSITAAGATISGNLTTNGNAGIGTASPTEKLEIAGNIKASGSITAAGATISGNLTTNGNAGIGTASPTEKLEVAGNIKASGSITAASANITGAFTAGSFTVNSLSVGSGGITTASGNLSFGSTVRQMINLWQQGYGIGVQGGTQYFRTDKNFAWYKGGSHNDAELNAGTGGAVQMAIKDGFVGIGTANPGGRLHVVGDILFNETNNQKFIIHTRNGLSGDFLQITHDNSDGNWSWGNGIILKRDGNVGIGTNAPTEKLEVAGNLKVNGYYAAVGSEVLRIIRGAVRPSGGIDSGSGFTVSKVSTGVYDINFTASFSAKPTVVVTQHYPDADDFTSTGADTRDNAVVIAVSTSKCRLKCGDGNGGAADRRFEFIAIGTR